MATQSPPAAHRSIESAWSKCRRKSTADRDRMAKANDGLARMVAHRWRGKCSTDLEDLTQIGRIGLLRAIDEFDPARGIKFSCFAVPWIQGEIQHYLRDHGSPIKIPRRYLESSAAVRRVQSKLAKLGREVPADLAAGAIGIEAEKWQWIAAATGAAPIKSLDELIQEPAELVEEAEQERETLRRAVFEKLAALPKIQRQYMIEFYFQQLSEEAIAANHSRSVVEVHAAINAGLSTLQKQFNQAI